MLENQLRDINLQASFIQDPWELISTPNLLEDPVAPSKVKISILFLTLGIISSLFILMAREEFSKKNS